MGRNIFLTGATGFIGSHLLARLTQDQSFSISCFVRDLRYIPQGVRSDIQVIEGDLLAPETYSSYLSESNTVVHLGAVTGKADPKEYFRVNTEATKLLLNECKAAGVHNFLFASTIAVKYADNSRYFYAQSKEQAEELVRQSGLNYCIVRPTIVIGPESPIWMNFSKIGKLPVLPVPGSGRARIQPIFIADLIECLVTILKQEQFRNETFDLGGPEETSMEEFLTEVYHLYHDKPARVVHVPLRPLIPVLGVMERLFYGLLPVNTGQLSAFRYDGVAEPNRVSDAHLAEMRDVRAMLKQMTHNGQDAKQGG